MYRKKPVGYFVDIWQWLTKPSAALHQAGERRRARLLLSLILVVFLLGSSATLLRIFTDQTYEVPLVVIIGWPVFLVLFYVARTSYYVFSGYVLTYLIAFINLSQPYLNGNTTLFPDGLAYATVSLILSSLFTSKRNTAVLAMLTILAIGFLPLLVDGIQLRDVESPIVYFIITSLLLILFMQHRDNLEKDRQAKLAASEQLFRRLYQEKSALLSASNAISSSLDTQQVLLTIAHKMVEATGVEQCIIAQWDEDTDIVDLRVIWPKQERKNIPFTLSRLQTNYPQLQTILETAQPVVLKNQQQSLFVEGHLLPSPKNLDLLFLPLYIGEAVAGFVELSSAEGTVDFDESVVEFCQGLAAQASIALEHAQLYFQIAQYAETLEERVIERTIELEKANEQLLYLSRSKDEFVSNVSHELRTPITNIMLYNQLITANPSRSVKYGEVIRREAKRLASLIEDLLRLSRLDQGREIFNPALFDLNQLVESYVTDRLELAHARSLTLTFHCQPGLPLVKGDRGLIGQVLSILLTNAMNYTLSGGSVSVRTARAKNELGEAVELIVSDTGIGISPKDQERLFERFFRGDASLVSGVGGTGLGLAIAQEIARLHQGEIEVFSAGNLGQDTKFILRLPVRFQG